MEPPYISSAWCPAPDRRASERWLLAEESGKAIEAVVQSHIVAGAALLAEDLLNREVEIETLGGDMLAIGGTAGVILVVPLEAAITDVKMEREPNVEAIPASAIVVQTPRNAVAGAELSMVPTGQELTAISQELTAVAMVVEPDIEADNGVIHGIDLVLLPPGALRSF
jgi:uncharacterized surface protein with fasciclin (FAS1) repeats